MLITLGFQAFAKDKPILRFHQKSTLIGEPIQVSLSYRHHKEKEILFPDTLYHFTPFEFVKKEIFPTKTLDSISIDSVVYTLNTFEIDIIQSLVLPIYIYAYKDTAVVFSNTDSIQIKRLVTNQNPDLTLKFDTQFQALRPSFDYIFWIGIVLGMLFFAVTAYVIFGKRIKKQIKLYLAKLAYDKFIHDFERIITQINSKKNNADLDKLLGIWKKYLQNITHTPTTTFTSKEISELINNQKLSLALNNIDRAIYGGEFEVEVLEELTILKIIAKEYYIKKQEEVKND